MSKRHEQFTPQEIDHVARIRAAGGDVAETFDDDGNRIFKIIRASSDDRGAIHLTGAVKITQGAGQ